MLHIQLFGNFQLIDNGKALTAVIPAQMQALLAYLVLYRDTPQSLQHLAAVCWSDIAEEQALTRLHELLLSLSHLWPNADRFLQINATEVQWQTTLPFSVDVATFEQAMNSAALAVDQNSVCTALVEAIDLYSGDLLSNLSALWVEANRIRLQRYFVEALQRLTSLLENQGDYLLAVQYARRLQQIAPQYEQLYRRLVHLYVLSGERASALALLDRRLMAAKESQGSLVLIAGVAGIGKTSLVQAWSEQIQSRSVAFIAAQCHERGFAPPFAPWPDLLAQCPMSSNNHDEPKLPEPFGHGTPAATSYQLMQGVVNYLRGILSQQPLVILLDDLHWAGQDALDLLDFISRQLHDLPLLILLTYRIEEVQRGKPLYNFLPTLQRHHAVEILRMMPLNREDTVRFVEARLGPCSSPLAIYLHTHSEGNLLFLEELLSDLMERRLLSLDSAGRWAPPAQAVPVPTLLQQLIIQRVERMGADGERLLAVAAVVGGIWNLAVIEALLGWDEERLLKTLEEALAAKMIMIEDERSEYYCFAHGLIRTVLYDRQLARRRKYLHAQIAALLEHPPHKVLSIATEHHVTALAYHFYAAEEWEKTLRYSFEAGDAARRRYAYHSAAQFYTQALEAAQHIETTLGSEIVFQLYERLGETYIVLNQKELAEAAFQHMLETARGMGEIRNESLALCLLSMVETWLNRLVQARSRGNDALSLATQVDDQHLLALAHFNLGHIDVISGELTRAQQYLQQAEQLARVAGVPSILARSLQNQAYVMTFTGHYAAAEHLATAAVEWARIGHDALTLSGALRALGHAQIDAGHYEAAQRSLQAALDHAQVSGESHYLAKTLNTLGFFYNELGDIESALHWDRLALETCRRSDNDRSWEAECYTLLNLATNELHAGRIYATEEHLRELEPLLDIAQVSRYRYFNRYHLLLAELALARGEFALVLVHTARAAELAATIGIPKNSVRSWLFAGQALLALGRLEEAIQSLQQAMAVADQLGHGSLRWKTRLRLAAAYAFLGQPNTDLYQQALEQVNTIANSLADEQLRSSFLSSPSVLELRTNARSPVKISASAPIDAYPAGLTAREVEVLRLVAQGGTNRQIAAKLSLSVKTINAHLTHIFNKIGCDNRTAAATFAIQHGLVK